MNITAGDFTGFSLPGKAQLIALYAVLLYQDNTETHILLIYKLCRFYVAAVIYKTGDGKRLVAADPIPCSLVSFYRQQLQ